MTYKTLSYTAFAEEAERELERIGLCKPRRPGDELRIVDPDGVPHEWPGDKLGEQPWDALSAWLGILAAWRDYTGHQAGIADYVETTAAAEHKRHKVLAYQRSDAAKVTDKRAEADTNADVMALERIVAEARARRALIQPRADGYATLYAAVSREIARREAQIRGMGPPAESQRSRFNRRGA